MYHGEGGHGAPHPGKGRPKLHPACSAPASPQQTRYKYHELVPRLCSWLTVPEERRKNTPRAKTQLTPNGSFQLLFFRYLVTHGDCWCLMPRGALPFAGVLHFLCSRIQGRVHSPCLDSEEFAVTETVYDLKAAARVLLKQQMITCSRAIFLKHQPHSYILTRIQYCFVKKKSNLEVYKDTTECCFHKMLFHIWNPC